MNLIFWKKFTIISLFIWLILSTCAATILLWNNQIARAIIAMGWGLILLWIILCGGLMYKFKDKIKIAVLKIPLPWQIKFTLFTALLALLEEAITTLMTNSAPLYGVKMGQAYITSSTNYFDLIFFHSVIFFAGMFVLWAIVLRYYDFSPFAIFIIFGLTGVLAEVGVAGPKSFSEFGLWIFVYGLMIFLPAYTLPSALERKALRQPKFYHYLIMIFLPILFSPLFAWVPKLIEPSHPQIHFSPIQI